MNIRHDRPQSELEFQVSAPLKLELPGGKLVTISAWSLSGFKYPEDTEILPRRGVLSIPFQGVDIRFPVELEPSEGDRRLRFNRLTGRQRETLALFYRSILSGRMASTEDVITSLDTPVDLVPMEETEEEKAEALDKARPRLHRIVWNAAFYIVFAAIVFGFVGNQIWQRVTNVRLQNARIVVPIVDYSAIESAFVDKILVTKGQRVDRGDPLIILDSPEHGTAIEAIRGDISLAESRLNDAEIRLEAELSNVDLVRFADVGGASTDTSTEPHQKTETLAARVGLILNGLQSRDDSGDKAIADRIKRFRDLVKERRLELRRLKRELANRKDKRRAINIVATTQGVIAEIHVNQDQYISRGQRTLTLEANDRRYALGWLPESAAGAVFIGQNAEITVKAGGMTRKIKGIVRNIEAGVDPLHPDEFGAMISVDAPDLTLEDTRRIFRSNAPVRIDVDRAIPPLFAWMQGG